MSKLNTSLLLIGHKSNAEYYSEIENEIKNNNLKVDIKDSIINVQEVLTNAKIGLHASKKETGPLVLIEYLAQGLPFLAYETGEVSQIVKEYYPEFFIDNFDINEWEERINYIKNQNYSAFEFQKIYEKHFSEAIFYNKLMNIYLCITN
jgi:glycosyltransferase involved in cell wall biosynthesis